MCSELLVDFTRTQTSIHYHDFLITQTTFALSLFFFFNLTVVISRIPKAFLANIAAFPQMHTYIALLLPVFPFKSIQLLIKHNCKAENSFCKTQ